MKSITDFESLERLQERLGYTFQNKQRFIEALTHRSKKNTINNERLEFLGDAVLDLVIAEFLFHKFPDVQEGNLSKMRAAIVNEKGFTRLAKHLELGTFLFLSAAEENNNGRQKPSLLSDAFEALFGAIYLESGVDSVKSIIFNLLDIVYPNADFLCISTDYKTALQEFTQTHYGEVPKYTILNTTGPDHRKVFEVAVCINGQDVATAIGSSKKEAQQNAAQIALNIMRKA